MHRFAAVIGDRKVVTEVKRKEVAQVGGACTRPRLDTRPTLPPCMLPLSKTIVKDQSATARPANSPPTRPHPPLFSSLVTPPLQAEYDEALSQGHTAVQLKQQAGAQLYSVEVGNLFGMEEAVITFSYVRILNTVAGAVEFEHQVRGKGGWPVRSGGRRGGGVTDGHCL